MKLTTPWRGGGSGGPLPENFVKMCLHLVSFCHTVVNISSILHVCFGQIFLWSYKKVDGASDLSSWRYRRAPLLLDNPAINSINENPLKLQFKFGGKLSVCMFLAGSLCLAWGVSGAAQHPRNPLDPRPPGPTAHMNTTPVILLSKCTLKTVHECT